MFLKNPLRKPRTCEQCSSKSSKHSNFYYKQRNRSLLEPLKAGESEERARKRRRAAEESYRTVGKAGKNGGAEGEQADGRGTDASEKVILRPGDAAI